MNQPQKTNSDAERWQSLRQQMPVCGHWAYFDHAGVAPIPAPTRDVLIEWARHAAQNGRVNWTAWRQRLEETRRLAAELLNTSTDEIALIRNTTEGVTLVAEGYRWQPGDNVVIFQGEFPSNRYPWLNLRDRGVEVREVPTSRERVEPAHVAAACDDRTRIIAVSWVGYATGYRQDLAALAEIAHQRGAGLFVDAIQGLGALPLDLQDLPVDFLAADGHKWLLGPEGAGLLFVRQAWLGRLRPLGVGWNSAAVVDFTQPQLVLKPTAGRYEGGTYNMGGLAALAASLRLLLDCGIDRVASRIFELTDQLCVELERLGAEIISARDGPHRSGIVACDFPGRSPQLLMRQCQTARVAVNVRAGWLRISPHAYATADDIQRLLRALAAR